MYTQGDKNEYLVQIMNYENKLISNERIKTADTYFLHYAYYLVSGNYRYHIWIFIS